MGRIVTTNDPVYTQLGITTATALEIAAVTAAILRAEAAIRQFLKYDPVQAARTEYYPRGQVQTIPSEMILDANDTQAYFRSLSSGSDELQLQHIPVRSITSLRIDIDGRAGQRTGSFGSDTEKTAGDDYWLNHEGNDDSGSPICLDGVVRSVGLWPIEPGSVKVVYVAGYSATEFAGAAIIDASPIYLAAVDEAARRARAVLAMAKRTTVGVPAGVLTSENLGDYSYSIDPSGGGADLMKTTDLHSATKQLLSGFVNYGILLNA